MRSLKTIPSRREVRDVADAVAQIERHAVRSTVARRSRTRSRCESSCATRDERLEVVERVLAALGVARAQARRDELLDERRLPTGSGEERPQVARVDAEARQPRAGGSDVGLALAVEALAALDARDDEAELLELAHEVGRDRRALAELGLVDLVLVAENADGAASRAVADAPGPSSSSRITRSGRNSSRWSRRIVVRRSMSSGAKSR